MMYKAPIVPKSALGCLAIGVLLIPACSGTQDGKTDSLEESLTSQTITVLSATYGNRCGVARGNATGAVTSKCSGVASVCTFQISTGALGDPARGCDKDFDVDYTCGSSGLFGMQSQHVSQEANGKSATLRCPPSAPAGGTISLHDASYGQNCGAPFNNAFGDVSSVCNGWGHCRYFISTANLGDPARGCDKQFRANYTCSNDPTHTLKLVFANAEANHAAVSFDCP